MDALCEARGKLNLGKILIVFFLIMLEKLTSYILPLKKKKKKKVEGVPGSQCRIREGLREHAG